MNFSNGLMEKEEGSFCVLINYVKQENLDIACDKFSEYFKIKKEDCRHILKSAPIRFIDGLSKKDVRSIKGKLIELSKLGIEFEITPQDIQNLPAVIWPFKVNFKSYSGDLITNIDFKWNNCSFVCPSCGETITIRPLGRKAQDRKIIEPTKEPEKFKPVVQKKESPAPISTKPPPKKEEPAEMDVDLKIEEPIGLDEPLLEPLEPIEAETVSQFEEPEIIEPIVPLEESETVELIPIDEAIETEPKKPEKKEPKKTPIKKPDISEATTRKVVKPETGKQMPAVRPDSSKQLPAQKEERAEGEVVYSVFLNKISDANMKEKAAKLLSEIKGISLLEAKQLVSRVLIPVLKNVTKEEADQCLQKFKKINIDGHVTKK